MSSHDTRRAHHSTHRENVETLVPLQMDGTGQTRRVNLTAKPTPVDGVTPAEYSLRCACGEDGIWTAVMEFQVVNGRLQCGHCGGLVTGLTPCPGGLRPEKNLGGTYPERMKEKKSISEINSR